MADWLTYTNQGATRSQPISPDLVNAMDFLQEMGVGMNVYSGGQDATGSKRVGSTRHDHGNAADVMFTQNGKVLDWNNAADLPILSDIVSRAKAAGVTGIGAGDDYMGAGRIHIGFGAPAVWGAGGQSANAPEWLKSAYYGTTAPTPAVAAINQATAPQQAPSGGLGGLWSNPMQFARNLIPGAQQQIAAAPTAARNALAGPLMGTVAGRTALMNAIIPSNIGSSPTVSQNLGGRGTAATAVNSQASSPVMLIGSGLGGTASGSLPMFSREGQDMNVYRANRNAIGGPINANSIATALANGATLYSPRGRSSDSGTAQSLVG